MTRASNTKMMSSAVAFCSGRTSSAISILLWNSFWAGDYTRWQSKPPIASLGCSEGGSKAAWLIQLYVSEPVFRISYPSSCLQLMYCLIETFSPFHCRVAKTLHWPVLSLQSLPFIFSPHLRMYNPQTALSSSILGKTLRQNGLACRRMLAAKCSPCWIVLLGERLVPRTKLALGFSWLVWVLFWNSCLLFVNYFSFVFHHETDIPLIPLL